MSELCVKDEIYHYDVFYSVSAGVSGVSAVCCLVVIFAYLRFKHSVNEEYRIVCLL